MFFRRGTSHQDDPWLAEKLWLFTGGAVTAILGMLLENSWLLGVGALLLASGVLIRLLPRGEHFGDPQDAHHHPDAADHGAAGPDDSGPADAGPEDPGPEDPGPREAGPEDTGPG
jgi:hypothetical protein